MGASSSTPGTSIPPQIVDALAVAYYSRLVAGPDSARSRAQASYAISSTFAAGLVGVGVTTTLATAPPWLKWLGVGTVVTWLIAAGFYMAAVSQKLDVASQDQANAGDFARAVMKAARDETGRIEGRRRIGASAALVAVLSTFVVFASVLLIPPIEQPSTVVLKPDSGITCAADGEIAGTIQVTSLARDFVQMQTSEEGCAKTVLIPRTSIAVIYRE